MPRSRKKRDVARVCLTNDHGQVDVNGARGLSILVLSTVCLVDDAAAAAVTQLSNRLARMRCDVPPFCHE